jgi:hypothetical protein
MKFNPEHHNRADGMTLMLVVPKNFPDEISEYWLDSDGVHLHAPWNITKAGHPDKRTRPQSLLRRLPDMNGKPYYAGHYVLATTENLAKLTAANAEIVAAREALDAAVARRDEALSLPGGAA